MTLEGKTQLMRLHRGLAEMPPDERKFIHDRIERFLNMTPAERARLQQNRKKWEQMTPEERQRAREEFRNRRQEFEQQRDADFGINPARACASNAVKVFFGCQTVCHMTKSQTNHLGRLK